MSKKLLKLLIICFWLYIPLFSGLIVTPFFFDPQAIPPVIGNLLFLPIYFLFIYSIYFFYKYDRYSKAGIKLFFLHFLFTPFYFYNVIWKRKRELEPKIKVEPVLGRTIFLEEFEEEDNSEN